MEPRVNINTASVDELVTLDGIGEVLANRIVEYRTTVGRFRTVAELDAVAGVSDQLVAELADRITVGETAAGDDSPELAMTIQFQNQASHPYTGHRLVIHLTRRETLPDSGDEVPQVFLCNTEVAAEISDDGLATVTLPGRDQLHGEVRFRIIAPDGELLRIFTVRAENLSSEMTFEVEPRVFLDIEPNEDPAFGAPDKIRGRVIDGSGRLRIKNKQVVIWGATAEEPQESDFRALIVAQTDSAGYFSGPYPVGAFTAALGDIAIGDGFEVAIHLQEDGSFPAEVLLVLDDVPAEDLEGDGDCRTSVVPRLPDGQDLVQPDGTYSDDVGARRCVDFTKPNRVLEEFSFSYALRTTEPEIRGLTLEEPSKISLAQILRLFPSDKLNVFTRAVEAPSSGFETAPAPAEASASAEAAATVVADQPRLLTQNFDARIVKTLAKDPDAFSATSLVTAANLTARDDLVRGINKVLKCAPARARLDCDSPVDWDDEPTIYQACTIAHGHLLRFKQEWVADGYSMGDLLYSLPLAPAQKKQIAVIEWERTETAARTESLIEQEQLTATLSRDRDVNEVVRATLSESIRGGSTARTSAIGGGLGIGVIIPPVGGLLGVGGGTSKASSTAWQNSSRRTAASSLQQLRDRTAQAASALRSQRSTVVQTVRQGERVRAETESVANYNHCHAITVQYFEVLRHLLVRQRLVDVQECLFVPFLMTRFNRDKALRWRDALRPSVPFRRLRRGFEAMERIENNYVGSDLPTGAYADETLEHLDGYLYLRFKLARPSDDEDGFNAGSWAWSGNLLPSLTASEFHLHFLEDNEAKDEAFIKELGPTIAENFVQLLQFHAVDNSDGEHELPIDATLVADFRNDRRLYVSLRLDDALPTLARKDIKYIKISNKAPDGTTALSEYLPANSKVIVESGRMSYRTRFASDYLFRDPRILNDLTGADDVRIHTPLNRQEQRRPREEDKELSRQLLDHLNENLERYHHAIWWRMSDDRRYMLLDGFEAPNSGGRSVASVVENELVGIAGNSLILPVARGFHLDPTFNQDVADPIDLLEHYQPNTPIEPIRIALPTKGVYAEAVMGACNSCEEMEEDRFWRWEQSPIPDSPTTILPVSTETRRAEPPSLEAKDFPAPIVAMQQAPAAPDPTGLAAALQLLSQPELFRDITGLTQNQQNALAALQAALTTAGKFGEGAAGLATTGAQMQARERMFSAVRKAVKDKLIDPEKAAGLFEKIILGTSKSEDSEPKKTDKKKESTEKKLGTVKKARQEGQIDAKDEKELANRTLRQLIDDGETIMSGASLEELAQIVGDSGVNLSQLKPTGESIEAKSFPDILPGGEASGFQLASTGGGGVVGMPPAANPLAAAERKFQLRSQALRNGAVHTATLERLFWENDGNRLTEDDAEVLSRLEDYARAAGVSNPEALAELFASNDRAWSAAFISYVMQQAGATADEFNFDVGHDEYIKEALANREAQNLLAPFWLVTLDEVVPEAGDLLCMNRRPRANRPCGTVSFDPTVEGGNLPEDFGSHCDLVTSISVNSAGDPVLVTVGGNISHSVRRRLVPVDDDFRVQPNSGAGIEPAAINTDCSYFAIVRLRSSMFETYPAP